MSKQKFTQAHEWLRVDEDGNVTIGITAYAQEQLGDVVFVELPEPGKIINKDDEAAVIESVKAAGEIKAPLAGTVTAINARLADEPEIINSDPDGEGWLLQLSPDDLSELDAYMDEAAYQEYITSL